MYFNVLQMEEKSETDVVEVRRSLFYRVRLTNVEFDEKVFFVSFTVLYFVNLCR